MGNRQDRGYLYYTTFGGRMRNIVLILMFLVVSSTVFADEVITDFEDENAVVVLNEELRQLREEIEDLKTRVTALEP